MSAPATPDAIDGLVDDLRELVAALDRRVPRLERAGEITIARDALHLRDQAVARLATLEKS